MSRICGELIRIHIRLHLCDEAAGTVKVCRGLLATCLAKNLYRDTADILEFLEEELAVPYPWPKYDQVVVEDYHIGGMENTSLTVLNPIAVFPSESENLRDLYGLIAHELVHQWFGDLVTCKDWSELYLNEGFAV